MSKSKFLCIVLILFLLSFLSFCTLNFKQDSQDNVQASSAIALNAELENYLKSVVEDENLSSTSLSQVETLTFDGDFSSTCQAITTIEGLGQFALPNLESIVIKNMSNLTYVDFSDISFDSLNLQNLPNLEFLDVNNTLKSLEISSCTKFKLVLEQNKILNIVDLQLENLSVGRLDLNFQMPKLENLKVKNCPALFSVELVAGNLKNAEIVSNVNLVHFKIDSSFLNDMIFQNNENLQVFDISNNKNLQNLVLDNMTFEEDGFIVERKLLYAPQLKKFFINQNDWLKKIDISKSLKIETIIITSCTNLTTLEFPKYLNYLQTLDLSNCYNLANLKLDNAENLVTLSLAECNLLIGDAFVNIYEMKSLQYLNLQGTSLRELNLKDFDDLQILLVGSNYIHSLELINFPRLYNLDFANSPNLTNLNLQNLIKLESLSLGNCNAIESLNLENLLLKEFNLAGVVSLNELNISTLSLEKIAVYDCENLKELNFSQCKSLKTIEVLGCASLSSEFVDNLTELENIEKLYISECDSIHNFSLVDKITITELNLKHLNNLTILELNNLGTNCKITLPTQTKILRSINLSNLQMADFGAKTLDLSKGMLSAVTLVNLPFENINLNDNMITVFNITGVPQLKNISLANNRITNVNALLNLLSSSAMIEMVDINNNRIDFSKGDVLEDLKNSIYFYYMSIGVQNIINDNAYTFKPEIYFGGINEQLGDIRVVVYKSTKKYRKASITQSLLNEFSKSNLAVDKFSKLSNGTYYIVFEKYDDYGKKIAMTSEEQELFQPIYFTISTEFDFVRFIWILFVGVAVLIFGYVGVTYYLDKKKKARLLAEQTEEGIGFIIDESMTKKEIKEAKKEYKKQVKENRKQEKLDYRNQLILEKEQMREHRIQQKEEKAQNIENQKLEKIASKEKQKEEKEQQKLEKERQKMKKQEKKKKKLTKEEKLEKKKQAKEERLEKKQTQKEQKELKKLDKEIFKEEGKRKNNDKLDEFDEELENFFAKPNEDEFLEEGLTDSDLASLFDKKEQKTEKMVTKKLPNLPKLPKK